ncbi:hypothetical protein BDZ89DRAFT_266724 [Hymenopellis radicata]|nr:hypothetical protein BDZ89DRAFT_266724 [Hymenopellis radicata]
MFGYGGMDRPLKIESSRNSLISKDLVEILDHEDVGRAVAVGPDAQTPSTAGLGAWGVTTRGTRLTRVVGSVQVPGRWRDATGNENNSTMVQLLDKTLARNVAKYCTDHGAKHASGE